LYIANKDGSDLREVVSGVDWSSPLDWSPDGKWIAYGCYDQEWQVCIIKPDGNKKEILTASSTNSSPRWSPDGQWITFISYRDGNWEVYIMKEDGTDQRRVTFDWYQNFGPDWRP